ncbi:proprotein convertase subtilisin/kexin type 9-like [Saccoglossus kowalevskii]|uniref:Proprotein convertase subtilisin/kexin type 9-like n=1 Tax=Saccoglossus kowalevskii TaxID=10224 RepID=A0ABM0MRL1_SACKO|nr:PREDICTED: proprotein convertase subtilisin/kexin type 9-like [Saccoglossus kowalevskii]
MLRDTLYIVLALLPLAITATLKTDVENFSKSTSCSSLRYADILVTGAEKLESIENKLDDLDALVRQTLECCTNSKTLPTPECRTRASALSGAGDDVTAFVRCQGDEVMTGCTSYLPGSAHGTRDGEYIEVGDDGKPVCYAQNGSGGSGVKAYARCCTWPGMQCEYAVGSKSGSGDDNYSGSACPSNIDGMMPYLTGCMARTFWKQLDGAHPNSEIREELQDVINQECRAYNGAGGGGVWAFSACCAAPDLECKVKWSPQSGGAVGSLAKVTCDDGWLLTGCSAYTAWTLCDGAYIEGDTCVAVNGGNNVKVWSAATCCRN